MHNQETIVFNDDRWAYHTFMYGPTTEDLDELEVIAESMVGDGGPFIHPKFIEDEVPASTFWGYFAGGSAVVGLAAVVALAAWLRRGRRRQ